jgi:Putative rhamnosyl transferase
MTRAAPFCHVVQTRFSVRARWGFQEFPLPWLEERLELFDAYCLPSVAEQTCGDFIWHVYCDGETDPTILAELDRRAEDIPQMEVALTGPQRDNPGIHVLKATEASDRAVLTTRLDSDDAIAKRYVEAIQAHADAFIESDKETWLLNFPRGYQLDRASGRLLFDWMPRSSFHTLFERVSTGLTTVLAGNHSKFHEIHPTEQDDSIPAWLMVIHEGNVINTLREYYTGEADPARLAEFCISPAKVDG